ncbi:hypothetical protein BDW02DRAFT_535487 [Decorospora gaudefroyi]|uniref:Uncharacterized protein n=1 Tax=Decorospora gaudefroyi TaxID=184978 RepID=A0A6A5JZN2_9PLEO|nr:hypothetical protein BDW02DRAFT_535487 [Decorospora gaudefroyi]
MPTSQPRNSNLLDRSNNHQEPGYSTSPARYASHAAASTSLDNALLHLTYAPQPDPFAYYKAFLDTSILPGRSKKDFSRDDDGYTCNPVGIPDAQDVSDVGGQPQGRARAVPYNLAVRLANRSNNGAPLATIVEQGSYSSLNSRGSLLSVGPFPSLRVENASPSRTLQRVSRSVDENALQRIQEDAQQELPPGAIIGGAHERHDSKPHAVSAATTSLALTSPRIHQTAGHHIGQVDCDVNNGKARGFFRGVLHTVRAASRTRSRSSSTRASVMEYREDRPEEASKDSSSRILPQASETRLLSDDGSGLPLSAASIATPGPERHARNRHISTSSPEFSARENLPLLSGLPHRVGKQTTFGLVPNLRPPLVATHSRERRSSVRLVPPEPHDAAQEGCGAGAPPPPDASMNKTSNEHVFYGLSVPDHTASSLTEHDRARETSRNASFCSTMSTSYSGTVLGVDIDLQHDFSHQVHRSRSPTPIAPLWFTPQLAELERQADATPSPPECKQVSGAQRKPCSITSSALTSLLPIAAASGIVRPNYTTPKISFFSPSGNLIQPEGSLTPGTASVSDFSGPPTSPTPYYNQTTPVTYRAFPPSSCLPRARPPLKPLTTPPTSSSPLPAHLQHHHNYGRGEQSQIDSTLGSMESVMVSTPVVKGCGGIVGTESLIFHTGLRYSHDKPKSRPQHGRHRTVRSCTEGIRQEARFRRARLITALIRSCTTAGKGRTLRKRKAAGRGAAATVYNNLPHIPTSETMADKKRLHNTQQAKKKRGKGTLGPLAGHALRICFCQPYDGAGKRTQAVAADSICMMSSRTEVKPNTRNRSTPRRQAVKDLELDVDVDAVLPNARLIVSGGDAIKGNTVVPRRNPVTKINPVPRRGQHDVSFEQGQASHRGHGPGPVGRGV